MFHVLKLYLFKIKPLTINKRSFSLNLAIEELMHDNAYLAMTYCKFS
jgi:hypothetical protein